MEVAGATWGAGHIDERGGYRRRFEPHYFMTAPEQFLYDHYPEETKWRLSNHPVSKSDYEEMVYVRPAFFRNACKLLSHTQGTITAGDSLKVTLSAPRDVALMARMQQGDRELDESLVFVHRNEGLVEILGVFPFPGDYLLRLFSKRLRNPGAYEWTLDYQVQASAGPARLKGFPTVYAAFQENGASLKYPLHRHLKSGGKERFELTVPGAEEVAVVAGHQWTPLAKHRDVFAGSIGVPRGEINVYAKFHGSSRFEGLLGYLGD